MSFLSGAFLFALPLALVPVAVHLYRRRQRDVVPWGAMQFLQQAARQGRRWQRVEELLLLIARCAVVLALVLALARPQVLGEWAGDSPVREVILVIDNSLSTSRRVDGETPFDELRERANAIITQLKGSDRLQYLLAVGGPDWQTSEGLTADDATKDRVRNRIDAMQPTLGTADLLGSVQAAVDAGIDEDVQSRHVFVLTDMQSHGWKIDESSSWLHLRDAAEANRVPTFVHIVPCGDVGTPVHNLAVSSVEASHTHLGTGDSAVVRVQVQNKGNDRGRPADVAFLVDGEVQEKSPVPSLGPGETTSMTWTWKAGTLGVFAVSSRITTEDQLAGDDEGTVIVEVVDRVPVLLVEGEPTYSQRLTEADLFASAMGYDHLQPHDDWHAVYEPSFVAADDLHSEVLSEYRAVVITSLTGLPSDELQRLRRFVEQGGGLWVVMGRSSDQESFNALWYDEGGGLSPLPMVGRVSQDDGAGFETIHPPTSNHVATAAIADTNRLDIDKVQIGSRIVFGLKAESEDLSVLLATGNGDPLAIEHFVGRGRVIVQGLPFDVESSNLPLTKAWVVMVNDWLDYLTQPAAIQFNLSPGGRLELPASLIGAPAEALLIAPDRSERVLSARTADGGSSFHFSQTKLPGRYEVRSADQGSQSRGIPFYVAPDSQESDLTLLDPAEVEFLKNELGMIFSDVLADDVSVAPTGTQPRPLWIPLLIGCLVLLAGELLLATRAAGFRSRTASDFQSADTAPHVSERTVTVSQ